MKIHVPNVVADRDRHGNVRLYFRRKGFMKVRLFETPGTQAFAVEVETARQTAAAARMRTSADDIVPGSMHALIMEYFASMSFLRLGPSTRSARRGILESICQDKVGSAERGDLPAGRLETRHVETIRDAKADLPEAANGRVKALRQMFKWAVKAKKVRSNPTIGVERLAGNFDGHHTWTVEEVRQFEKRHPIGSKARLALAILLYTGTRRSDAVRLGRAMERGDWLHFTEVKNATSKVIGLKTGPKHRELPILPEMRQVIDGSTKIVGDLVYLITEYGRPFTANGFGNFFKKRCEEAGLPHCSAHGLRKAGATIAAENGATEHELMAIYGWASPAQAALYTRKANRRRLVERAMHKVVPAIENEDGAKVSH